MFNELDLIIQEEAQFQFDTFDVKKAYDIGCYVAEYAMKNDLQLCVDIYANGKTYFHFASEKCIPDNDAWLLRKRNTVLYFHHSSRFMKQKLKGDVSLLETKYGLVASQYALIEGGFPIYVKGAGMIGAICVSGLAPTEDHQMILDAIKHVSN